MALPKRDSWVIRNAKRLLTVLRSPRQFKHFPTWLMSFRPGYALATPLPWLNFDAIDYLKLRAVAGWRVFEYGSGGSTLFWLKCGADVVSVEHDPQWHTILQERLVHSPQVDYRLVLPESGDLCERGEEAISRPDCYRSSNWQYAGMNFRCYASQIDEFPDQYFDLVIVDGRARPACIMHSIPKIKTDGMLVLDNADRPYYLAHVDSLLAEFELHQFYGMTPGSLDYTQTNIYVKRA